MNSVEATILWVAVFGYAASFIFYLIANIFKWDKGNRLGLYLLASAFTAHTMAITVRWLETGHPPVMGRFENHLAGSWFVILMIFFINRWVKKTNIFGLIMIPFALIMLGQGLMSQPQLQPLAPNYKSNWLWIHVTFAWLAYSSFSIAGGLSLVFLLKGRYKNLKEAFFFKYFPELDVVSDINLKFIIFGFISQTVMLISGSIWANSLWGSYWSWDVLETWALITWLAFAIVIHFRFTLGWKGNRVAWLTIISLSTVIIAFFGIGFISDMHTPLLR